MFYQRVLLNKALIVVILILFIGMSVVSSSRNVVEEVSDNTQLDSVDMVEVLSNQNSICYGYCINDPSGQLIEGPISFSLNDLGNISQLWGTSSLTPMVGGAWTWDGWFCCEYGSGKLWKIDYDSGYMIEIGGGGIHLNGLSWSSDDILVGSSNTSLYMVDEETGEQTFIGSFGLPEASKMGGIAFDFIAQRLYGVEYINNRLYEIDPENSETEYIGQLGIEINGTAVLDYNVEDDCLYLSTFTDQGELYNVDKETGECSLIGELQGGAEISALTINPDRFYLPTANFNWFPHYPQPGENIVFNASSSYDQGGTIVLYVWDWDYDLVFDENSTNPVTVHMWDETGYYPVTLLVQDNNNCIDTQRYVLYVGNHPPDPAHDPIPPDGANNVPGNATLYWNGSDPNSDDTLTYDVFFSINYPPILVSQNQTETCYDPYGSGDMPIYEDFYWRIVTWDRNGLHTSSPIWTFETYIPWPPQSPEINGPTHGRPGKDYNFTFVSTDPDNQSFKYIIKWGDGDTVETDYFESGEVVTLNHTWNEKGEYIIKAIAEDIWGEQSSESEHPINIPRNKAINFNINLLSWLFDRFPLLEVFLRAMNLLT